MIDYQSVRKILIIMSFVLTLFDPMGWVARFAILIKMILQELWKLKLPQDNLAPDNSDQKWITLCQEIKLLNSIYIR